MPGQPYTRTKRVAYLPDNAQGQQLLQRLKYAFLQGLTFDVGYSITDKKDDRVADAGSPEALDNAVYQGHGADGELFLAAL